MAVLAGFVAADSDFGLLAEYCFFEFKCDVLPQIGSALGSAAASRTTAKEISEAEEVAKNFADILEDRGIKPSRSRPAYRSVAETIVSGTLVCIREDGVGLAAFLEFLFRIGIVRIAVGMKLQRQFAIGALDFLVRGAARNPEYLVIIAFYVTSQNCPSNPFYSFLRRWSLRSETES